MPDWLLYYRAQLGGRSSTVTGDEVGESDDRWALEIGELPDARLETCGAYMKHDFEGARDEIKCLARGEIESLEKPPLLN